MTVTLGNLQVDHKFIVLDTLSTPVILGCDFLTKHNFIMDFSQQAVHHSNNPSFKLDMPLVRRSSCNAVTLDDELPQALPTTVKSTSAMPIEMPGDVHPDLVHLINNYRQLFSTQLGKTTTVEHVIDTGEAAPIKVPPRPIPFHYAERAHQQLLEMAKDGIIRPSNSPWCAPAVYVPKENGEIRICVDFVQLNRVTKKNSYPVPRADGPQQKLAGKCVFSKLDLRSAYWQFPMQKESIEKTAFSPGPGYGLWEFTVMPYGLTGATQTCQQGLDSVLHDCKYCVDNYVDDIVVFSSDMKSHARDLQKVLGALQDAGFTLRGSKCVFGKMNIKHLGFQYGINGVSPSADRIQTILNWPVPKSPKELRSFLGLTNFYRRFVHNYADIAAPLTDLTSSKVTFTWSPQHQKAFETLRQALVSPPILDYPTHDDHFVLTTDASDVGLGAILSTLRGIVVEYASRSLNSTERKYSTTEKECLAIVWAVRKFRHFLLGAPFTLETDHKPLEWLESAKISHARSQRLERWSLELRAYDFKVVHRPGKDNCHVDSLSRLPISLVALQAPMTITEVSKAQRSDPSLSLVIKALEEGETPTTAEWKQFPLRRYKQIWRQLLLHETVLCRKVKSPTMTEEKFLIVVPASLRKLFLSTAHDKAGHQGSDRTMSQLSHMAYWVGMAKDTIRYCSLCSTCQISKSLPTQPAPLQPIVASRPWELVAVDILKVPQSAKGNQYILVAQDYFSKWPFAQSMPDQKAERIVKILRDQVFTLVGPPQQLHSDQGQNFESHILSELCKAFQVTKSHTTPYHPMGDGLVERMNRSLLNLLRTFTQQGDWEQHLQLLLFVYRTTKHSSTGLSPYEVIFGCNPPSLHFPNLQTAVILDPGEYSSQLRSKLLEIRELVDANMVKSSEQQQHYYKSSSLPQLKEGQKVLLSNATKGKLDPQWTGPWIVQKYHGPTTLRIKKDNKEQVVHINRVRPFLEEDMDNVPSSNWSPPLFQNDSHDELLQHDDQLPRSRSGRTIRPVDYYGH